MTTYYKVVTNELKSSNDQWSPVNKIKGLIVQYKINEWVTPIIPNTKLFVFNDIKYCREFIGYAPTWKPFYIYECKVKNPSKPKYILSSFSYFEDYFKAKRNKKKLPTFDIRDSHFVDKCTSVSAIKLIQRIV